MGHNNFKLNYDQTASIAKHFKDEGEDIARLHSETRQRVRDLYKEWIGEGADKFFEEMEIQLLPALQRLSVALFHTQDVTNEIMKIIQNADEETAGYFKDSTGGDDFGASKFGEALTGLGGLQGSDDFGASKFGQALGGDGSNPNNPGAGQPQDSNQGGGQNQSDHQKDQKQPDAQTNTQTTSGGGGGGGSNEGLKGNLKNMGTGLGSVTPQNAESGGGGGAGSPANMPDHVFVDGGGSSNLSGGGGSQPNTGGGSSSDSQSSSVGGAAAAGAAVAGGGAAKVLRGRKKKISGE